MAIVRILAIALAAIAAPVFGFSMDIKEVAQRALCGGRPYARISVPNGASPYVEPTADGVSGPFLLDYGATRSSLSAAVFSGADERRRSRFLALKKRIFTSRDTTFCFNPERDNSGLSATTSYRNLLSS
jgi:hypothetical protein